MNASGHHFCRLWITQKQQREHQPTNGIKEERRERQSRKKILLDSRDDNEVDEKEKKQKTETHRFVCVSVSSYVIYKCDFVGLALDIRE